MEKSYSSAYWGDVIYTSRHRFLCIFSDTKQIVSFPISQYIRILFSHLRFLPIPTWPRSFLSGTDTYYHRAHTSKTRSGIYFACSEIKTLGVDKEIIFELCLTLAPCVRCYEYLILDI